MAAGQGLFVATAIAIVVRARADDGAGDPDVQPGPALGADPGAVTN